MSRNLPKQDASISRTCHTSSRSIRAPRVRAPSCSTMTARSRASLNASSSRSSRSRAGSSTTRRRSGRRRPASPSRPWPKRGLRRARHRRHRHHQPARDHDRLGSQDRPAHRQRHRLAGSAHGGVLRSTARRTAHEPLIQRAHRPGDRRLFLGHARSRWILDNVAGRARAGRSRRAGLRHGRLVADLEAHRRTPARHRCQQRLAHACCSTSTRGEWDDELLRRAPRPAQRAAGGRAPPARSTARSRRRSASSR